MASPQPPVKKAYVDTVHGQIHYRHTAPRDISKQGKVIVMLHKSASSSVSYESLMVRLHELGHECYALDMPGFGNSFDPSAAAIQEILAKGTRWYVDTFISALTTIGIFGNGAEPVHLVGHHSGASLAPEIAALRPEAVGSVSLIGTAVMTAPERAAMKEKYFAPFNKPVEDGSHLQKTWDYLRTMGASDLDLQQREAIDHIRAWKGRNQIYGAVWEQELSEYLDALKCPVMFICARDDVLWSYQEKAATVWKDAKYAECKGANFSPDLDVDGILEAWLEFTVCK